jgi:hypothetical protein
MLNINNKKITGASDKLRNHQRLSLDLGLTNYAKKSDEISGETVSVIFCGKHWPHLDSEGVELLRQFVLGPLDDAVHLLQCSLKHTRSLGREPAASLSHLRHPEAASEHASL